MKNETKNKMLRTAGVSAIGLASMLPMQSNAQSTEKPLINSPSMSATFKNQYNGSRGFISNIEGVMQNDFNFNVGKVNVDFWSDYDFKTRKVDEIDFGISYGFNLGKTSFNVSATEFHSPAKTFKDCVELGISASRNLTSGDNPLSITAYAGQIVAEKDYEGTFLDLELKKSIPIVKDRVNLDLSALVAYNDHYFGVQESGFSHGSLGATLDIKTIGGIHVKPFYSHQFAIENLGGVFKDTDTFGVSVSKSF